MHKVWIAAFTSLAAASLATPAVAQKSKDTLRLAVNAPFAALSGYHLPVDEAGAIYREVYESLLTYDEYNGKLVPMLAKSWKQIDPRTIEFELRDDIKFHNGNKFDADDVVATLKYVSDPKVKLTFKPRYSWIKDAEKLGSHKVKVVSHDPKSVALSLIAYRFVMWDGEAMAKLDNVADYGRLSPVGTGAYKVVQVDKNAGTVVERHEGYNTAPRHKAAPIKRIHAVPMPDRQTQAAQLMTGGVDMLRNVQPDTAKNLATNPDLRVTNVATPSIFYIAHDAAGVSDTKVLTDPRVRLAIHKAIDREQLIKHLVPGGEVAEKLDAICFKTTIGCKFGVKAPDYDPEGAKKLLKEAGYPNGIEFDYLVYAPMGQLGEAVAGELRKVGIKANVQLADIGLYRRKQGDGKLQSWSILFPTGSHPDAANILGVYFGGPAFQYYQDPEIKKGIAAGEGEFDPAKRAGIYKSVFDRINEMHYIFPVTSIPTTFAHTKDVRIEPDKLSAGDVWISSFVWN